MFSTRFKWHLSANRLSEALDGKKRRGEAVMDLTDSNPTRCGLAAEAPALLAAVSGAGILRYRPDPRGSLEARRAVAAYYLDHGIVVDPGSVFLTASTSEAYSYIFKLLTNPEDNVLVPVPSYPLFEFLAGMECVETRAYPLSYDPHRGWSMDISRVAEQVDAGTRAVVVVNPNNPTGSYLKRKDLQELSALCRDRSLALIVDEVFLDYASEAAFGDRVGSTAGCAEALTFVLSGLSKVAGTPQIKLGWMQIGGPQALVERAQAYLELVGDTYLSVSAPAAEAAAPLLAGRAAFQRRVCERLDENERALRTAFKGLPDISVLKREGGWYGVLALDDGLSDEALACGLLEEAGVHLHPGYFYDFTETTCLVVSLLTPKAAFQSGIDAAARYLAAISSK